MLPLRCSGTVPPQMRPSHAQKSGFRSDPCEFLFSLLGSGDNLNDLLVYRFIIECMILIFSYNKTRQMKDRGITAKSQPDS